MENKLEGWFSTVMGEVFGIYINIWSLPKLTHSSFLLVLIAHCTCHFHSLRAQFVHHLCRVVLCRQVYVPQQRLYRVAVQPVRSERLRYPYVLHPRIILWSVFLQFSNFFLLNSFDLLVWLCCTRPSSFFNSLFQWWALLITLFLFLFFFLFPRRCWLFFNSLFCNNIASEFLVGNSSDSD